MRIFKENLELIINLNQNNYTNREIANMIGCHHNTISYNLKKYGLESSWSNQAIDMFNENIARCKKCKQLKPLKQFQYGRKGQKYQYRFSYCNKCRKNQTYLNLNSSTDKFLSDRYNRLKRRAKVRKIKFNITKEYFIKQFHEQKGRCFYTNQPMRCLVGEGLSRVSLSVDKVRPEKGYIKGNLVFCTHKVNTIKCDLTLNELKMWIPKWYNKIQNKT